MLDLAGFGMSPWAPACVDDVDKNKCEESGKQLEQSNPFPVEATQAYTPAEPTPEHMLASKSPGGRY